MIFNGLNIILKIIVADKIDLSIFAQLVKLNG